MSDRNPESRTAEDLIGGDPALDFVNTAGGRDKSREPDRLGAYAAFLAWAEAAGLLTATEAAGLAPCAQTPAAARVLDRAVTFREALHALLLAVAHREAALPSEARREVEAAIRMALADATLVEDAAGLRWDARNVTDPSLPFHRTALAAQELFGSGALAKVRACERCSWLFVDRSRGRPRRWCSMAACGNRAKAARHYARRKAASREATGGA